MKQIAVRRSWPVDAPATQKIRAHLASELRSRLYKYSPEEAVRGETLCSGQEPKHFLQLEVLVLDYRERVHLTSALFAAAVGDDEYAVEKLRELLTVESARECLNTIDENVESV